MGGVKMEQQNIKYSINGTDGNYEILATEKTRQTVFRQTPSEYEKLKNDAHAHRMNISEYLRWLIDNQRKEDESNGKM